MPARILVAEDSVPVNAALRRALEGAGYAVDALPLSETLRSVSASGYNAAIIHRGKLGAELARALRGLDPNLPVIQLALDEEEAASGADEMEAEGTLVGPLAAPAVVGAVRMAERLGRAARHAAEAEGVAARRRETVQELALLKRMMLLEVKRSRRYGYPVSLGLFAVDGWAQLAAGLAPSGAAALLAELLAVLTSAVRDIDLAVPFDEDRLVVLMPHTGPEGALAVARRLVARVREREATARFTVSAGIAGHAGGGTVSFGVLVKAAVAALTRARAAGGDRAEAAEPASRERVVVG
jgi:two-component system, cell cycle response regulator